MSHVFLVGFMGAGKSCVGELLARGLGRPFVDLDEEIAREARSSIAEIFAGGGEGAFREAEREALGRLLSLPDAVVACGGGVVTDPGSRALLGSGTVAYLQVTCEEALDRVRSSMASRPLLASGDRGSAAALLASRVPLYEAVADIVVSTSGLTAAEVAAQVADALAEVAGPPAERPIRVETPTGGYDVVIGQGLLAEIGAIVSSRAVVGRCALVTDESVRDLYGEHAAASLRSAGIETEMFVVPAGEASKSWGLAGELLERFSDASLGRDAAVVALGGGVVGDLAGFCAATYLRGVPVVQVPTTLLAQSDSSIGGKTGVDLPRGKNLAGAFWPPLVVVSDTDLLASLPAAEWASGLAEVAKSAILSSAGDFERLELDAGDLAAREARATTRAVGMAAAFKARIVSGDEREAADRECLNYGHTLGHALEKVLGFGEITHGRGVAEGMRFAARLSATVIGSGQAWTLRQDRLLDALGLAPLGTACDPADLLDAMRSDKKVRGAKIRFVLSAGPGIWRVEPVDDDVIAAALDSWCANNGKGDPR